MTNDLVTKQFDLAQARQECDWCPFFSPDAMYIKDIEIG